MTIRVTTSVVCDICGTWIEGDFADRLRIGVTRKAARDDGWRTAVRTPYGDLEDYCDACQEPLDTDDEESES